MRSHYHPQLGPSGPRFAALVRGITDDIQRGRLLPGERLPGTRELAERLGLGRNTVVRAYRELRAEGWLEAETGSGTRVREALNTAVSHRAHAHAAGFPIRAQPAALRRLHAPPGCPYPLLGGTPDLRLLPLKELSRAYGRVLRGRGRRLVSYGDPFGESRLREALASWLAQTRGLPNAPERVLVTRGSQMALYLSAQTLLRPGDAIAVERFGYDPAWQAFRAAGVEPVGVPVDEEGLVVDQIPDHVRAIYVTPHHQYPTGALLSVSRRMQLLAFAAERQIPIFEDDYDHEYPYEGRPVLPLAALDRHGVVVYIGTLSKAFAPGLRLGWVCCAPEVLARMAERRRIVDRQGDRVVELAVAELLEDGVIDRHIRKTRRVYAARRELLLSAIESLPLTAQPAQGGLAVWCRSAVDPDAWAERAQAHGVFFSAGSAFTLDGSATPHLRLGFAGLAEGELHEAVARLAATAP